MTSYSPSTRTTHIVTAVNVVAVVVAGIALARLLGPAGRGDVAFVLVIATFALDFGSVGATEASAFWAHRRYGHAEAITLFAPPAALALLVYLALMLWRAPSSVVDTAVIGGLLFTLALYTSEIQLRIRLGRSEMHAVNAMRLIRVSFATAAILLLAIVDELSVSTAVFAYGAAAAVAAIVGASITKEEEISDRPRVNHSAFRRYAAVAAVAVAAGKLNRGADLLVFAMLGDRVDLGLYAVAVSTTQVILAAAEAYELTAYSTARRDPDATARRILFDTFRLSVILGVGYIVVGSPLIESLYGSDFSEAAVVGAILVPGVIAASLSRVISADLRATGFPRTVAVADITGGFVTIALVLLAGGSLRWSAAGASVGYAIGLAAMTSLPRWDNG